MTDILDRLRSNATLVVCPFDKRSPDYYSTPNDKPCKFCGSEPEGPDKCTGADLRIMEEAADEIATLRAEVSRLKDALGDSDGMENLDESIFKIADAQIANLRRELAEARDKALEELASEPLPPHVIAAAWQAWYSRHGGKLGPGPAFTEAVSAAVRAMKGEKT